MVKKDYYEKNRDIILNKAKEYYINNKELILENAKNKYKSLTEDEKQKLKVIKSNIEKIILLQKTKNKK